MMKNKQEIEPASLFVKLYGDTTRNRVLSIMILRSNISYKASDIKTLLQDEGLTVSTQSLYNSLKELKRKGLIEVTGMKGNAKKYQYSDTNVAESVRRGYIKTLKAKTKAI